MAARRSWRQYIRYELVTAQAESTAISPAQVYIFEISSRSTVHPAMDFASGGSAGASLLASSGEQSEPLEQKTDLKIKREWLYPSKVMFDDWMLVSKIGLPSALQLCLEWWIWEISIVFAGWIGPTLFVAHNTVVSIYGLLEMVYIGTSAAGAALVGNAIGAGDAPKARRTVVV